MGIIDRTVKQTFSHEKVTTKEIADMLTAKLNEQYKVEFKPKGNVGKQMLGALNYDSVLIVKNAYHRMRAHVEEFKDPNTNKIEYHFYFDTSEISPVLKFIGKETGLIGHFIIKMIYGEADEFYDTIINNIKNEYPIEERETQVGLKALFGNKN